MGPQFYVPGRPHGEENIEIVQHGPFNPGFEPATFQSQVHCSTDLSYLGSIQKEKEMLSKKDMTCEWMNEWMIWIYKRKNKWMNEIIKKNWMNKWMNEWMNEWLIEWTIE